VTQTPALVIRPAQPADAAACARIYGHYVRESVATFETVAPSPAQMSQRMAEAARRHLWLVACRGDDVLGYACAHAFGERQAFDWTCETSVYVDIDAQAGGIGRALMTELIDGLTTLGQRRAVARIEASNVGSVRLHERLGFRSAGTLERVGFKHGAWRDLVLLQLDLAADGVDLESAPV
jgi:phosphinothricin acetyltransferase